MRIRVRAASLCAAALFVVALLPAAAQAQDAVLVLDETTTVFDTDGDGVADPVDNCINDPNPTQANLDGDAMGDACDPDDDNDVRPDATDNCPQVPNVSQSDYDLDGIGNACDDVETTEGFLGGGGIMSTAAASFSIHSRNGTLSGSGRVIDGSTTIVLRDVTTFHSTGDAAWATGHASINGGAPVTYYLEVGDGTNFTFFEVGGFRWAGPLRSGNIVVK
ncbi:MAG TPA: thrombospondin type 3 repeat-containing protein [Solirubrobacteraceae bacterium]|jgi:hypothetical protein